MKQLVGPNLLAKGQVGWCLSYVHDVFDTPVVYPSAWLAWEGAQFKHTDALPEDVAVPVFFSYFGTIDGVYANWGHVVVHVPGKGFYSSPWTTTLEARFQVGTTTHAVLPTISDVEHYYGCKYVGWSEDVNKVRVVGDDMPNDGDVHNVYLQDNGRKATNEEVNVYVNKSWSAPDGLYYGKVHVDFENTKKALEERTKALALYQAANGDIEATMVGKALIKLIQTFGYKKGA